METLIEINPLYNDLKDTSTKDINDYIYNIPEHTQTVPTLNPGPDASLKRVSASDVTGVFQHFSIHPISHEIPAKQMDTPRIKTFVGQPLSIFEECLD